jgi:hypothetical protein
MINLNHSKIDENFQDESQKPLIQKMLQQPIHQPILEHGYQWRLKLQQFTNGGFEAKAILVNRNQLDRLNSTKRKGGPRSKTTNEAAALLNLQKCAYRAASKVRHLCLEIGVDRLLTLTSRNLLTDYDDSIATWKRFMRILEHAGEKFEYIAVPELHKNGNHYHIHVAINGFVRADMLRRCWQIALGGKGDEKGEHALGNIDIKCNKGNGVDKNKQTVRIARYISKYITKSYLEHHLFNRKRYWAPRTIKLPESQGEWMRATTIASVLRTLYSRFDTALVVEAVQDKSLYITEANAPMIFLRYLPNEDKPLPTPF